MRVVRWLAAAGVWLSAVAAVAAVAWFAIDSAGREVGGDGAVSLVAASRPATQAPVPAPGTASPSTSVTGRASPTPTRSAPARDVAPSPSPPSQPSSRPTARPSGTVTPRPTPTVPGASSGRTATFSSSGGDLVVWCIGAKVDGWRVRPADGWRADPKLVSRGELEMLFTSGEGSVIEARALCREEGASILARSRSQRP